MSVRAEALAPDAERRRRIEAEQFRRLEAASVIEATTLLLLVLVAVPLKHMAGWPLGVRMMGPVHGLAFLFYGWTAVETVAGGGWRRPEIMRLLLVAFIPLAGFANVAFLRRKAADATRGDLS